MKLLTPREVAITFGVDHSTVTRWVRKGILKGIRLPSKKGTRSCIRINEEEVKRVLRIKED